MPIIHRVDQGTVEWKQLRLGIPTASNFHLLIQPVKLKPSASAAGYMYKLICERLLNEPMDEDISRRKYIEDGKVNEPHAAQQFSFTTGMELEPVGFVTNDKGTVGCSPDRLIVGHNESVEIKCPAPWTHMENMLSDPGSDYRAQVQGQLLVGGFDVVHFYSWHPQMPEVSRPYQRDPEFIAALTDVLGNFCEKLNQETERARSMGTFVAKAYYQAAMQREAAKAVDPEYLQ